MSPRNVVNAVLSTSTVSSVTGSRRCKAPKVVCQRKPYPRTRKHLILFRKKGLRVCTFNTRTLNYTGAATFLDHELQKWNMQLAGLQGVRWLSSGDAGESTVCDTMFLLSGRSCIGCPQECDVGMFLMDSHQRTPAVCKVPAQCQSFISHCCLCSHRECSHGS